MAEITLEVSPREGTGKALAKKMRRAGEIPAIVYGAGKEPVPISVDTRAVSDLITKSDHGIRSIFLLKLKGREQQRHAMIKELQIDPITRKIQHIDFVRVMMDEVVRVHIPVHHTGTAIGQKMGGMLDFQVRDLHVECLPGAIPDEIVIDITPLEVNHFYRISDLSIPEGVKVLDDIDRVVVSISAARIEEVEPTEEAEESAEPEVIGRGKGDEADEES